MKNHLHIAMATDDTYVPYLGISMYSLMANNAGFADITFHILDNGISEHGKCDLENIAKQFSRNVIFYDCRAIGDWLGKELMQMFETEKTNVPIASYARLFLPQLLPQNVEKVLYLDADSIVTGSFGSLWSMDISQHTVMGVLDNASRTAKEQVGLSVDFGYINAGMLYMNISKLRAMDFTKNAKRFINHYKGRVYHHDQGVINGLLADTIGILPPQYNMMSFMFQYKNAWQIKKKWDLKEYYSNEELEYAKEHPVFVHFTEGYLQRPWSEHCRHPLQSDWCNYKSKTKWSDMPVQKDMRNAKLKLLAWMNIHLPFELNIMLEKLYLRD